MTQPLLAVEGLAVALRTDHGLARILDDVALTIPPGGSLGVVGESGCGKSTLLRAILGILPKGATTPSGRIRFQGRDLLAGADWARGRIGFVPQDPYLSLNPVFRAGDQILEIMRRHAPGSRAGEPRRGLRRRPSRCPARHHGTGHLEGGGGSGPGLGAAGLDRYRDTAGW